MDSIESGFTDNYEVEPASFAEGNHRYSDRPNCRHMVATNYSMKKSTSSSAADRFHSRSNVRNVGLRLQGLGQLSLAFEKFKHCEQNDDIANLLYNLSVDFQIKGEPENAKEVLFYISTFAPEFKDVNERLQSLEHGSYAEIEHQIGTTIPQQESDTQISTAEEKTIAPTKTSASTYATQKDDDPTADEIIRNFPQLYAHRYKVIDVLGQGTTGAVFKGKDITTDELVAIKVLNLTSKLEPKLLDEYKFRFHREIVTAENLNHPNIVKIYQNGEIDGFPYIVMEYIDGVSLRSYVQADKLLSPKNILKLIAQCADALTYAHKQNIIHRDIKPANILYNQSDDYVTLTDFGIAKIPDSTRTIAGSLLGTPLYMSPEQLAGEPLDARSDLFSLGVTLYHLLTGSPPFQSSTMTGLMRTITDDQHKDLAVIDPGTPSPIIKAVNKALEKNPKKRFQSAASMAKKLRECLIMLDS